MQKNIEHLTSELVDLPEKDRLEIIRFLLFLDNHSANSKQVESTWKNEISDRVKAVEDGTAECIDYNLVQTNIIKRFST